MEPGASVAPRNDAVDPSDTPAHRVAADVRTLRELLASIRGQARTWIWVESLALVCLAVVGFFWASLALDWWLPIIFQRSRLRRS
jgi:hypothetical protein